MDVQRPDLAKARRLRRYVTGAVTALVVIVATVAVARLKPAAPTVDRGGLFIDTVRRGEMLRQVRGTGTLVPENVRWIPAATEARVERIVQRPGAVVTADAILIELTNAEVEQAARDAELQLGAAMATQRQREVELESSILAQMANSANIDAQLTEARAQMEVNEELNRNGVVPAVTLKLARSRAAELETRSRIEKQRIEIAKKAAEAEKAVQRSRVEQFRAMHELRQKHLAALHVRAGIDGVLQQLTVEIGQRVAAGTPLAKVAQPQPLKAELRVAETQARDVAIGQTVVIDTRNGTVRGRVARVDPAVQNGTIGVDVTFDGPLPRGARPDLTVDGVIEIERLSNVLYVGRPVQGSDNATIGLFRLNADGTEAVQTSVAIGRTSVSSVEIRSGLREGDQVILSDMSAYSEHNRIQLK